MTPTKRILVTAGPTREYIDPVRFITNASSGRMGCAVADSAVRAGHQVTLLLGEVPCFRLRKHARSPACVASHAPYQAVGRACLGDISPAIQVVRFVTVDDLKAELEERFADCDALVMAAAVGDFRPLTRQPRKLPRAGGAVELRLIPTEDIAAGLGGRKRSGQTIVTFAVEDGPAAEAEAKARAELAAKNADYVVVNTPDAMAAEESYACILSADGVALPWATRPKGQLADRIVELLGR